MPNPVKRRSMSRRNVRRAHDFLKQPPMSVCPQCGEPNIPHRVCFNGGTYKGREVIPAEKLS